MDQETLLSILRARDASVDAAALQRAFADEQAAATITEWAQTHLGPDTLLSLDELTQFTALEQSGKAAQLSAELATAPEFSDDEVRDAITELERATAAIAKQTDVLQLQQDALRSRLVRSNGDAPRAELERARAAARDAEAGSLAAAVADLVAVLDTRLAEAEKGRGTGGARLQDVVAEVLGLDDRLLASLQKLGWELEVENPDEVDGVARLRETCARLIKYAVETVRTRLDRVYLESLDASARSGTADGSGASTAKDVTALQEELESLYAEILPVAQMSIEQQFLQPALKEVDAQSGQSLVRSEKALEYVHACLDYLLDRTDKLSARIRDFQAHQSAADTLIATAKAELAVSVQPPKRERRPTVAQSPARVSPVRARPATGRRSSIGVASDEAALDELLCILTLAMPSDSSNTATVNPDTAATGDTIAYLSATLADRRAKAADVARNVQRSLETAAAAHGGDARRALQLVRDAALADSSFGKTARLMDGEVEASIGLLALELDDVAGRLAAAEAEMARRGGRSVKREEVIKRWGRR